ncbi:VirB4 family type IV secretion system protein [Paraburkholderia tropica]|uniref:VirB4 family type IV secretion system protein n=1 Tax=Paraburkholderia tropica TaxID=92647 RepID=UPI002AB6DC6F|nr:conjugal transfer protein TraC [Paraburkholderia tropica]
MLNYPSVRSTSGADAEAVAGVPEAGPPAVTPAVAETLAQVHRRLNGGDARAMAELLAWLYPVDSRNVVNKDSALMAAYEFTGPDPDSITPDGVRRIVNDCSRSLRQASRRALNIWWLVHRRQVHDYETLPMPDAVSQIVDDNRRAGFEQSANYVNRHYMVVCMPPELGLDRFAGRFRHAMHHESKPALAAFIDASRAYFSDQYAFAYSASELEEEVARFEDMLAALTSTNPDITFRRLSGDAYGGFLNRCASPVGDQDAQASMDTAQFLDVALASNRISAGDSFVRIDGAGQSRFGFAVGIPAHRDNWPDRVYPAQLDELYKLQGELIISHLFRVATRSQAERYLKSMRRYHDNRKISLKGILGAAAQGGDTSAVRQNSARAEASENTQTMLDDLSMGRTAYGWYNFTVMALSPGYALEEQATDAFLAGSRLASEVESVLRAAHYVPVREGMNVVSAFASTTPGMWREASRWAFVNTDVLARQLPLRTVSRGEPVNSHLTKEMGRPIPAIAPLPTGFGTAFWFTSWWGPLGHLLLVGESRTGKTIFAAMCWTLARKIPGSQVVILDKDYSSRIPVMLQGGQYIDFSAGAKTRAFANPMKLLRHARHHGWLIRWVETLVRMRGYSPTTQDQADIDQMLHATRALGEHRWRLHALYVQLPERANSRLREELAPWVGSGPLARYFDNDEDAFDATDLDEVGLIGVELGEILRDPQVAPPLLDYLVYRINDGIDEKRRRGIVAPTILSLPEVHQLLRNPMFESMLDDWLKTLGKKLGQVWMDSQSPEDYYLSGIFPSLRDNVPTRVFLPIGEITPSLLKAFQDGFGLNRSQVDALAAATRRRDYFITQKDGFSRMVSVQLDLETVAILRSESSAVVLFEQFLASGTPDWRERYITEAVRRARAHQKGEPS